MEKFEYLPKYLKVFAYVAFISAVLFTAHNIHTRDWSSLIPSVFALWVFGPLILIGRKLEKRVRELEEENGNI